MSTFISIVFLFLISITNPSNPSSLDINTYPSVSIPSSEIRVIDGDTFIIKEDERVRIACIDSPDAKSMEGLQATKLTQNYINNTNQIILYRLGNDIYGRTVGIVKDKNNVDLGQYLLHRKGAEYKAFRRGKLCRAIYPVLP
jgi:endonuclease YncB( thermonuclease family)